jgi:HPt (histidine-containing phosphotransfer) domain-containing protein
LVAAILHLEYPARGGDISNRCKTSVPNLSSSNGLASGINWQVLETRYKNKPAFIRTLLQTMFVSHAATPDKLRDLADKRDFDALAFLAHNLKGTAGNMAATDIQALAAATETSARKREADSTDLALRLAGCVSVMMADIQVYLNEDTGS